LVVSCPPLPSQWQGQGQGQVLSQRGQHRPSRQLLGKRAAALAVQRSARRGRR
jgi:hypothetical protein